MSDKIIFTYPEGPLFTAMWAQISGMADCCSAGVIGRLSGLKLDTNQRTITINDTAAVKEEYQTFPSMRNYIMQQLPKNRLFAGPPEWLHWAIMEDLLAKKTSGHHTPQIKAKSVPTNTFDFEANPYHKFWAGVSFRVGLWFMTDSHGAYMSHADELRMNAFKVFIRKNVLGDLVEIDCKLKNIWGGVYVPDFEEIAKRLPDILKEANTEMARRWKIVAPHVAKTKIIADKVAIKW